MRTIIAGSRSVHDMNAVLAAVLEAPWVPTTIISGTARGADQLGEQFASDFGLPVTRFPADWQAHGRRAGHLRNAAMAEHADALIALWDGHSPGTANMIETAKRKGLAVHVHRVAA